MKNRKKIIICLSIVYVLFLNLQCSAYKNTSVVEYEKRFFELFKTDNELFETYKWYNEWAEIYSVPNLADMRNQTNSDLISKLKDDPFEFGFDKTGKTLMHRGQEVLDDLIPEFAHAEDYYLLCLTNILANIPSKQRDDAFIKKLNQTFNDKSFLRLHYIPIMMNALAINSSKKSISILSKYAQNSEENLKIRSQAKIALSNLGQNIEFDNNLIEYKFSSEISIDKISNIEFFSKVIETLFNYKLMIMDNSIPNSGLFLIEELEKREIGFRLKGYLPKNIGKWKLDIGHRKNKKIPIYYSWRTAPLAGAGYIGVLEKHEDSWKVIFWKQVWIS